MESPTLTTHAETKSHLFPRQFGMRAILIVTAFIAVLVWFYVQSRDPTITWQQANEVYFADSLAKEKIIEKLGKPHFVSKDSRVWHYKIAGKSSPGWLQLTYDSKSEMLHSSALQEPDQ